MKSSWYSRNKEIVKRRARLWALNNPEKRKAVLVRFAERNRANERERARRRHKENPKRNLERLKKWQKKARLERPEFVVKTRLRCRLRAIVDRGVGKKINGVLSLIGCTLPELRQHIENQFIDGMCWARIKEIHIDHIRPCADFDLMNLEEQQRCFHYSNLQPLWKMDNLRKGQRTKNGWKQLI